jgi:hypothetical protein
VQLKSIVAQALPRVDVERFRADLREGGVEEMLGILLDTFVQDCPARLAAHDYIRKPLEQARFVARVKAALRRAGS